MIQIHLIHKYKNLQPNSKMTFIDGNASSLIYYLLPRRKWLTEFRTPRWYMGSSSSSSMSSLPLLVNHAFTKPYDLRPRKK